MFLRVDCLRKLFCKTRVGSESPMSESSSSVCTIRNNCCTANNTFCFQLGTKLAEVSYAVTARKGMSLKLEAFCGWLLLYVLV